MTTEIPTDRHGNVYWGPTTFAEAERAIREDEGRPKEVADMLDRAGYPRIAARIRSEWIDD